MVEPGVFDYTIQTVPDDRNIVFDDTVYSIKIYVTEYVNKLEANMIATKSEKKYSGSKLIFVNSEESQGSSTEPSNNDRNPKTSDDTRMENTVDSLSYRHAENDKEEKQRKELAP